MSHIRTQAFLLGLAVAMSQPLAASAADRVPGQAPLRVELSAKKVLLSKNGSHYADASEVKPGEIIEYQARYRNEGKTVLKHLNVSLPIPGNTTYLAGSAQPGEAQASRAGASDYGPLPLMHSVAGANGTRRSVEVPLEEYRSLRWRVGDLAPGAGVTVTARVKVNALAVPAREAAAHHDAVAALVPGKVGPSVVRKVQK